jgi:hypothetical protein
MRFVSDNNSTLVRHAIDASLECWASWREERDAVEFAYQRWTESSRVERRLAFAAYRATLDREEHAARSYAEQCERVGQISTQSRRRQPATAIRATTAAAP